MEAVRLPSCVLRFGGTPNTGLLLDSDEFIEIHSEAALTYVEETWYEKDKSSENDRHSLDTRKRKIKSGEFGFSTATAAAGANKRQKLVIYSSFEDDNKKNVDPLVRREPPEYYYDVLPDCYNDEDESKKLAIAATGSRLNWDADLTSSVFSRMVNKEIKNRMSPRKVVRNKKMSKELKSLQQKMISRMALIKRNKS